MNTEATITQDKTYTSTNECKLNGGNVAVVILNYNGRDYLKRFLPSVLQHSGDAVVIVADNGSTDDSCALLREQFPMVQRITFDCNYGFAEGYNRALRQIDAQYYILLNSDVEVSPDWITPLLSYMDTHPNTAACQPKLLSYDRRDTFEYSGAAGGYIDRWGYPFCRGRVMGTIERDQGRYNNIAEVFWATGACLMIRSQDYHANGGLDGCFFAHMEEIDLCWRLKARGRSIVCIPQSTVWHVGGGTLAADHPRKTYLNFRNNLLMIYKNTNKKRFRRIAFVRFWLDIAAALHLLLQGHPANAREVLHAQRDFLRMRPQMTPQRDENLRLTTVHTIQEMLPQSLLVAYYLKGAKTYDKLMKQQHHTPQPCSPANPTNTSSNTDNQ